MKAEVYKKRARIAIENYRRNSTTKELADLEMKAMIIELLSLLVDKEFR